MFQWYDCVAGALRAARGDGDEAQRDEEVEEGVVESANTLKVQGATLLTCGARDIKTKTSTNSPPDNISKHMCHTHQ